MLLFVMRTVVIIEDHEMMRAGLSSRLKDRWLIAGEAGSLKEAKKLFTVLTEKPDLILLDMELGKDWGLDILKMDCFTSLFSGIPPVLVYSVYDDYAHVNAALRQGVMGYVLKSRGIEELLQAMEDVVSGKTAFSPSLPQRLASVSDLMLGLTKREREVFVMVQQGFNNTEIAGARNVSVRTIENVLSIIYDKTGAKNRGELKSL